MNPVSVSPVRYGLGRASTTSRSPRFAGPEAAARFTPQWQADAEELMGWLRFSHRASDAPARQAHASSRFSRRPGLEGFASLAEGFAAIGEGLASLFDFRRPVRPPGGTWRGSADRLSAMDALRGDWEAVTADMNQAMGRVGQHLREAMIETLPELMKSAHTDGRGARLVANFYFQAALSQQGPKIRITNRPALLKAMQWSRIADRLGQEPLPVWIYSPQWQAPRALRFTLTPAEDAVVQAAVEQWEARRPSVPEA